MIQEGDIFIHPTDTIYGIGCLATDNKAVEKVRNIKNRLKKPLSIIVPSKEWIYENCETTNRDKEWIEKLPGPYTLILNLKKSGCIASNVNLNMESLGVRLPDHWITELVEELNTPIITTSANVIGEDFMTSVDNLDREIASKMNFIIYEGEKTGRPSKIIHLNSETPLVKER